MRLRNKKTLIVVDAEIRDAINDGPKGLKVVESGEVLATYTSLAQLNTEWEDYEEPKEHWYINYLCEVDKLNIDENFTDAERSLILDRQLEIGNYFETKEEAEKAVEKLKAWKRLKDEGFEFIGKTYETDKYFGSAFFKVDDGTYSEDIVHDLYLLFGGEE